MRIPIIDNIIMTSDSMNIILNREVISTKGETKGKLVLHPFAYFPDVVLALEDCLLTKMMETEAKSIKGLVKEHHELVLYFKELLGTKLKGIKL